MEYQPPQFCDGGPPIFCISRPHFRLLPEILEIRFAALIDLSGNGASNWKQRPLTSFTCQVRTFNRLYNQKCLAYILGRESKAGN